MVTKKVLKTLYKMRAHWELSIRSENLVFSLDTGKGFCNWFDAKEFKIYFFLKFFIKKQLKKDLPKINRTQIYSITKYWYPIYLFDGKFALQARYDHLNRTIARLESKIK